MPKEKPPQKHEALRSNLKTDISYSLLSTAARCVALGGILAVAQLSHLHPTLFLDAKLPNINGGIPALDGIAQGIYAVANTIGGFASDHLPYLSTVTSAIADKTPIGAVINKNLVGDVGVLTGLSLFRGGIRVGAKSLDRSVKHAESMQKVIESGEIPQGADVPTHVTKALPLMKAARTALTAIDAGVETAETVADGVIVPYGWRDADALGFLALGWHPLTGEMDKVDKTAMFLSAVVPFVPPLMLFGPYVGVRNIFKKKQKHPQNNL